MIAAADDSFIPAEAPQSLKRALENSKADATFLELPGDHLRPGSDRLIGEILEKVEAWLLGSGAPISPGES